jgi:uncharacterized protein YkwD
MKTDQRGIFTGQWLIIARFFAGIALLIALAVSALAISGSRNAEALDSEEQTFLGIINDYRAQHGLGALALDPQLNEVARWMANDLAANDYFSHTDSQGRDPFVRMDQMGYSYNTWRGENLVAGTSGAQASFEMWTGSPGHNANMLGEHYTVIGIARAYDEGSSFGWYWATEFGGHTAQPAPPPAAATQKPVPPTAPPTAPQAPPPTQAPQPAQTEKPTQTPKQSPPPTPTNTPEPNLRVVPAQEIETTWWRSLQMIGDKWQVDGGGGTFVSALRDVVGAFGR